MIYPIYIIGFCAFLISLLLTPLCRNLFRRLGIVDRPDEERKLHTQPVAHMGGVPIAITYLASCLLLFLVPRHLVPIHLSHVLFAAPGQIIETAADQRKALLGKVDHCRCEIELCVQPRLHRMLVRRLDVGEMICQQRARMTGNELRREELI